MKTEITKRSIDNKFALWAYMVDPSLEIDDKVKDWAHTRWIIVGVFDEETQAKKSQAQYERYSRL